MAYTSIDKPTDYFTTNLRSGLYGGSDTAFDIGFQPDWIWDKRRSDTSVHALYDSVRGFGSSGKVLYSSNNNAEATNALIDSVSSTGFTIKASSDNTGTLVDWCWKAGTAFSNDASSTSVGTIDSVGSFNNDAGFSIVTYSGTGSNGTIKHGLNSVPKIIFWKRRDNSAGAVNWIVQSTLFGNQTKLVLNTTEAFSTNSSFSQTDNWTSALIDLKTYEGQNASNGTYVAYCFAEKKGYSKIGNYLGNGSTNGAFVYTGFKPAFLLIKVTNSVDSWRLFDNKRSTSMNPVDITLRPNTTDGDYTASANNVDFLSNGFKMRTTSGGYNGSSDDIIYMAFAESPFVTSTGIPTTAR